VLSTPPAFVLSQDQTLQQKPADIGTVVPLPSG
ncbi:MAG: cell envelope biogenesis protein TolA, partial [Actinobacteria bacterium]|nr:cell envelope biogenesis protein TolA [Actinomycetota bacterium]